MAGKTCEALLAQALLRSRVADRNIIVTTRCDKVSKRACFAARLRALWDS
jgi:hypothetical protein